MSSKWLVLLLLVGLALQVGCDVQALEGQTGGEEDAALTDEGLSFY